MYQKITSSIDNIFTSISIFLVSNYHMSNVENTYHSINSGRIEYSSNLGSIQEDEETCSEVDSFDSPRLFLKCYSSDEEEINALSVNSIEYSKKEDESDEDEEVPTNYAISITTQNPPENKRCFLNCFTFLLHIFKENGGGDNSSASTSLSSQSQTEGARSQMVD